MGSKKIRRRNWAIKILVWAAVAVVFAVCVLIVSMEYVIVIK